VRLLLKELGRLILRGHRLRTTEKDDNEDPVHSNLCFLGVVLLLLYHSDLKFGPEVRDTVSLLPNTPLLATFKTMATRPVFIRNSSSPGVIAELHPLSPTLAVIDLLDSLLHRGHKGSARENVEKVLIALMQQLENENHHHRNHYLPRGNTMSSLVATSLQCSVNSLASTSDSTHTHTHRLGGGFSHRVDRLILVKRALPSLI
jgi:hypothetical protein